MKKICCYFNFASHYRKEIYLKLDSKFNCDFFFTDVDEDKIKKINYSLFNNSVFEFKTFRLFGNFIWTKKAINLCFKNYETYIITGEYYNLSNWFLIIINKLLGKKTYLWNHAWYGNESHFIAFIKKLYFKSASGVLLYGEYARNLMLKEGFNDKKLHVIYNSLHYEDQLIIRKRLGTNLKNDIFIDNAPIILFTGRLTEVKKLDLLLEAQKKLLNEGVIINVIIVGDGPKKESLIEWVNVNNTKDHVCFYGECYDENKIAVLYHDAFCCVSPGNVGLTAIHAMTYGCPVISHSNFSEQMPEFESILPGKTGCFFEQDNVLDLASKIKNVLAHDREYLREQCYKIVDEKFNTRYQIELISNILNKLN